MLSLKFKPVFSKKKNLLRLGPNRDGGYVLDRRIIKKIDHIITCGLNDDWEFEKDFIRINPKVKVIAYDHTVDSRFWFKRLFNDLVNFFLLKKLRLWKIINIFKFFDYCLFFKGKNQHFKLKVSNNKIANKETNLKDIIKDKKEILLKIDIEASEYLILDDISKNYNKINCLIIEFHNIKKNLNKIEKFIKKIKNLEIIHIHGNNIQNLDKYGYPYGLEITFVNNKKVKLSNKKNLRSYPIKGIDFPNVKRNKDINLLFK